MTLQSQSSKSKQRARRPDMADGQHVYRPLAGDEEVVAPAPAIHDDAVEGDDLKLRLLGYKPQLKRDLT